MLIVGAKGFAKEVLEVAHQLGDVDDLVFYDDVSSNIDDKLYNRFDVLRSHIEVEKYFTNIDIRFTIGIGNPILRSKMVDVFTKLGGALTSIISPKATIGCFGNNIEIGCNIMTGVVITNDVEIGKGVLINLNSTIGHDTVICDFVEISPGVNISGNCKIGAFSIIGTNAVLLPKVRIGKNVIVGAGSVVTKDIPDNCLVIGTPAVIKKQLPKLTF